jgi:cell wall-associated NlpC family hydrolase
VSIAADEIEREARRWLGTPFVAGASVRGAGCDCGGLLAGVFRTLRVPVIQVADPAAALALNATSLLPAEPQPGAILALSQAPGGPPVHLAIQMASCSLIHAHWSRGVVENRFGRWFWNRLAGAYILKGTSPWQP